MHTSSSNNQMDFFFKERRWTSLFLVLIKYQKALTMYTKPLMSSQSDVLFGMHKVTQVVRAEALEVW